MKDSIDRIAEEISTLQLSMKLPSQVTEYDSFGIVVAIKLKNLSKKKKQRNDVPHLATTLQL